MEEEDEGVDGVAEAVEDEEFGVVGGEADFVYIMSYFVSRLVLGGWMFVCVGL